VFTALRRLHPEIYYYKTKTGREVDFIVPMRGRSKMLVQVCESLAEPQTRKRETAALSEGPVPSDAVPSKTDEHTNQQIPLASYT
jgi:predicted AAA+ superfamily ATPase